MPMTPGLTPSLRQQEGVPTGGLGGLEDVLVDLLVDVADARAALIVGRGVGLVDVADFARFGVHHLAVDLKLARDFRELFFAIRGHKGGKQ